VLAGLASASVQGHVALGPHAGAPVRRLGEEPDLGRAASRGPRQAQLEGFHLPPPRQRLGACQRSRPPRAALLAAITPRPAIYLLLYHGVLALPARWCSQVVRYARPAPAPPTLEGAARPRGAGTPGHWPRGPPDSPRVPSRCPRLPPLWRSPPRRRLHPGSRRRASPPRPPCPPGPPGHPRPARPPGPSRDRVVRPTPLSRSAPPSQTLKPSLSPPRRPRPDRRPSLDRESAPAQDSFGPSGHRDADPRALRPLESVAPGSPPGLTGEPGLGPTPEAVEREHHRCGRALATPNNGVQLTAPHAGVHCSSVR
jgi:hypothetical protein